MIAKVIYSVPHIAEIDITEDMIRNLYNQFHDEIYITSKIVDTIDEYIQKESGYVDDDGRDFEFLEDIEEWIAEVIERLKEEEMFGTEEE